MARNAGVAFINAGVTYNQHQPAVGGLVGMGDLTWLDRHLVMPGERRAGGLAPESFTGGRG